MKKLFGSDDLTISLNAGNALYVSGKLATVKIPSSSYLALYGILSTLIQTMPNADAGDNNAEKPGNAECAVDNSQRPDEVDHGSNDWHCGNGYLRHVWIATLINRRLEISSSEFIETLENVAYHAGPKTMARLIGELNPSPDDDIPF